MVTISLSAVTRRLKAYGFRDTCQNCSCEERIQGYRKISHLHEERCPMENKISKIEELKDQVVFLIEGLEEDFKQYSEMRDEEQTDFIAEAKIGRASCRERVYCEV